MTTGKATGKDCRKATVRPRVAARRVCLLKGRPGSKKDVDTMVQDTISNAILIIAAIIATTVMLNAVYPAVFDAVGSVRSTTSDADSRSKTSVTISTYSFSPDYSQLNIWMKNSGKEDIDDTDNIRVYYGDDTDAMKSYHIYVCKLFADDPLKTSWSPGETFQIGFGEDPLAELPHEPGIHRIRVVLTNGAMSETTFTI
jgi:hypothetical protein